MTENEYHTKLSKCKTDEERIKLNDEFIKFNKYQNKNKKIIKYLKDNILAIIALIIAILDLVKDLFI